MSKLSESQKKFVDTVAMWLKTQLERKDAAGEMEIELRFGYFHEKNSNFVSGVGVVPWQNVRSALANVESEAQCKAPQTVLEIVKIYESPSKIYTLRSIEHANGKVTTQCKTNIAQRNFAFMDQETCARLSSSVETPHEIDLSQPPVLIRARARTTFWYGMWRIDLSQVQQGIDESSVELAPAVDEIEIELLPDRVDWSKHDYHYVSLSLLLKIGEILNFMNTSPGDMKLPEVKLQ